MPRSQQQVDKTLDNLEWRIKKLESGYTLVWRNFGAEESAKNKKKDNPDTDKRNKKRKRNSKSKHAKTAETIKAEANDWLQEVKEAVKKVDEERKFKLEEADDGSKIRVDTKTTLSKEEKDELKAAKQAILLYLGRVQAEDFFGVFRSQSSPFCEVSFRAGSVSGQKLIETLNRHSFSQKFATPFLLAAKRPKKKQPKKEEKQSQSQTDFTQTPRPSKRPRQSED